MNFYEDKIDAYLAGKLNTADQLALEEGMKKDPLLKSEVEFQKDIIDTIKNNRKIQLKNRLNRIDVSTSTTGVSSAVKIAASFITVGIIGAGVYYYSVFSPGKHKENVRVVVNENVQAPLVQSVDTEASAEKQSLIAASESLTSEENRTANNNAVPKNTVTSVRPVTVNNAPEPEITAQANVPNGVIAETESDRINRDATINIPDGSIIGETNISTTASIEVGVDDKNKKDFSYKYYNNKLFLYGNFNEQPYNLFEVNSPKSKHLYLYFDGKYYELKANQATVTRLKEVKDPSVLKHLNK